MEHGSKRHMEGSVAKDMLVRCAEDAACEATSEMKAITSQGARPARGGTGRGHGRKGCSSAEKLEGLVKAVSKSVDSKISNLSASVDGKLGMFEQRMQEHWKMLENRWTENSATR